MEFRALIEIEGETNETLEKVLNEFLEMFNQKHIDTFSIIKKIKVTGEETEYKDVDLI